MYHDIDPQDIDPDTGRPYSNYSSPSLDTTFHDIEMDVDEEEEESEDYLENPNYPLRDWQYEVANGDTRRGYQEWVEAKLESED